MTWLRLVLRERFVLLFAIAAMLNRGIWLLDDPPFQTPPPDWTGWLFITGAVVLVWPWLTPRRWGKPESLAAALAVIVPYWLYVVWVLDSFAWARIQGTVVDLALIPVLVAFTFGRRNDWGANA